MVATGCLHEDAIHILALRWQSVDHDNPPVMLPRRTWKEMRQPQRWPLQQSVAEGAASSSSSPSSSSSLTSSSVGIGLPRYGGGVVRILQQPLPPLVHLLSLQWWNIPNDPRPTKSDDGTFDSEDEFGAGLDAGIVGSASVGGIGSGGAGSYSAGGGCDHINKKRRSSGRDSSVTNFPIVAAALRSVRHPKSIRELFLRFQHLALGTNAVAATINAATKQVLMIRTETASSLKPNITKSEIGGSFIAAKASAINTINPALSPKESEMTKKRPASCSASALSSTSSSTWVDVSSLFHPPRDLRFCGWTETNLDFTPLLTRANRLGYSRGFRMAPGSIVSGVASFC